jgi:hypothetical protein
MIVRAAPSAQLSASSLLGNVSLSASKQWAKLRTHNRRNPVSVSNHMQASGSQDCGPTAYDAARIPQPRCLIEWISISSAEIIEVAPVFGIYLHSLSANHVPTADLAVLGILTEVYVFRCEIEHINLFG